MKEFLARMIRRQPLVTRLNEGQSPTNRTRFEQKTEPKLDRNLNLSALIFLCVSNSIGSGVFVLTGQASADPNAGQYVFVAYLLAGVACLLAALCFAEFASRVKSSSGSSYSFAYFSLGEFVAFLIGWMLLIGQLSGISATSITWSQYVDSMLNNSIRHFIKNDLHLNWNIGEVFSSYLDIPALLILLILFSISLVGMRISTVFNNALALIKIILLILITLSGFVFGKFENLTKPIYKNGFDGIIRGSSIVMFAYFGFESSTFAIDESINPGRNVPLSLIISISLISLLYCGSALSLNLMQPFDQIDPRASFPTAFKSVTAVYWLVTLGPAICLLGSLFTNVFSIVRLVYSMSKDGLLFQFLAKIHKTTKVPYLATVASMLVCMALTAALNINDLIGFSDVCGFLVYSTIGLGLLVVRYCHDEDGERLSELVDYSKSGKRVNGSLHDEGDALLEDVHSHNSNEHFDSQLSFFDKIINYLRKFSFFKPKKNAFFIILFVFLSNVIYFGLMNHFTKLQFILMWISLVSNVLATLLLAMFKQNKDSEHVSFKVPLVPVVPVLVIILNNYLMMASQLKEWIIFGVVLFAGLPIYFFYGINFSRISNSISL